MLCRKNSEQKACKLNVEIFDKCETQSQMSPSPWFDTLSNISSNYNTARRTRKERNSRSPINEDKPYFKELIYLRKIYPIEIRDKQITDNLLTDLIKKEIINDIFQHKLAKIFSQRILKKVMKDFVSDILFTLKMPKVIRQDSLEVYKTLMTSVLEKENIPKMAT